MIQVTRRSFWGSTLAKTSLQDYIAANIMFTLVSFSPSRDADYLASATGLPQYSQESAPPNKEIPVIPMHQYSFSQFLSRNIRVYMYFEFVIINFYYYSCTVSLLLHSALSCVVYCNRPCLFVCLFVCGSALLQPARAVCVASERFFILHVTIVLFD